MADLSSLLGSAGIGGAIGKAIVSLELETTKYQAELKTAQAQTVASTNSSAATMGKFSSVASGAWLAVGAAAVAGAAYSVKAAVEANDAQLKLQNTFENNPRLSDSSAEAFTRQADALRDLTGVDDEAIVTSQALLGQFDLTGDQVLELTPLIVDLSEKMGIDLETAARAVGKATQGNTATLSRYGISVDEADTKTGQFTETVEGLGVAQGFAADSAKQEPWRVLGAQFEEIAEQIGQALLPVLQTFADALTDLMPILEKVIGLIKFLPFFQMAEDLGKSRDGVDTFANAVIDTIPILGHYVDIGGDVADKMALVGLTATEAGKAMAEDFRPAVEEFLPWLFDLEGAADDAKNSIVKFAGMGAKAVEEWSDDVKESFDKAILSMEETEKQTVVTREEFMRSSRIMRREAEDLSEAMKEIAQAKWVPDKYVAFLSEQGPEWLVGFANLTETQQHKAVEAWRQTTDETDKAKSSLDKITGALDDIGRGKSTHTVTIKYDYVGFDPSKPGMAAGQTGGATSGQQR